MYGDGQLQASGAAGRPPGPRGRAADCHLGSLIALIAAAQRCSRKDGTDSDVTGADSGDGPVGVWGGWWTWRVPPITPPREEMVVFWRAGDRYVERRRLYQSTRVFHYVVLESINEWGVRRISMCHGRSRIGLDFYRCSHGERASGGSELLQRNLHVGRLRLKTARFL